MDVTATIDELILTMQAIANMTSDRHVAELACKAADTLAAMARGESLPTDHELQFADGGADWCKKCGRFTGSDGRFALYGDTESDACEPVPIARRWWTLGTGAAI